MRADDIKHIVSVPDILQRYGVEVKRGRCRGFCHDGRDQNMQVSEQFAYCHVCHAKFDIFSIVQHFENCDFKRAKQILDPCGHSFADEMRARKISNQRKAEEQKRKEDSEKAMDAECEYIRLVRQREMYKPKSPDEPLHPLFAEALQKLEIVEMRLMEV